MAAIATKAPVLTSTMDDRLVPWSVDLVNPVAIRAVASSIRNEG